MTNNQFTDAQLQYFSDSALGILQRRDMSPYEIAASEVIIKLVAEIQALRAEPKKCGGVDDIRDDEADGPYPPQAGCQCDECSAVRGFLRRERRK
ncbi:hypothetical protein BKM35_22270 [Salmonella enterica]|nr:hypothetical protein [Salmonella enterica]